MLTGVDAQIQVEYKARPSKQEAVVVDPREDPRTSDLYFLFEERVPLVRVSLSH